MKSFYFVLTLFLSNFLSAQGCSELFFSEYSEGSSNNKYFEIYNPTANAISLSGYTVYLSGNGGSFTNSFTTNATIASGDVYVAATNQSSTTILAEADTALAYPSVAHFNGDDALILVSGTDTIDIIGVPGFDPGTNWTVGSGSTRNHTLIRKAAVDTGSTDWTTGATEWDVYAQDTWTYVGSHTSNCSVSGPTTSLPNIVTVNSFNGMNQNGVVDSLGVYKWIKGIVTSIDFDGNSGYVFYLEDFTDGINIYSPTDLNNYTSPMMGDSLLVYGQVGQFRGLTQLVIDSLILINQNNTLPIPSIETTLDETTESELIKLVGVNIIDPSQWPSLGSSANVNMTNGTDTMVIRIDSDTDIDGSAAPAGKFDVTGLGSQYDFSSPYSQGYQLLPRSLDDFVDVPGPKIVVSEIMPGSNASSWNADWFEIYNYGDTAVDLAGMSWDDESGISGTSTFPSVIVDPGEAVVVWNDVAANENSFLTSWRMNPNSVQVISSNELTGSFPSLSQNGDGVYLFDTAGIELTKSEYISGTTGYAIEFDSTGAPLGNAIDGVNGAYTSLNGDVGSPGNSLPNLDVTFQVDLGSLTPNSNGIHVAGSFQGWSPSTTSMTQVGNTSVYSVTVTVQPGKLEYKFINGNSWGDNESVPAAVQVGTNGNSNRWAVISSDTTLPAVLFAGAAPAGKKAIQFKVDMSLESLSSDSVHIAGSFQGWDPSKTQMVNFDGMHRYIAYVGISDTITFKFVNGNAWSSTATETVPSNCNATQIGLGGDRYYIDTISGIYESCFNQCGACFILPTYDLTINIDLNDILSLNTVTDVTLAGPINSWSGTDTLSDIDGDGVYTLMFSAIDSGNFEYKIRWHDLSGNTNWEAGANKIVSVSSDTILPIRCFGNDSYGTCITSSTANHSMNLQACTGDIINYAFDITSAFDSTNTFRVEISDFTTNYSSSSPSFSGNYIDISPLSVYQVDTNYQITVKIPDSLLQGVYSVRLVSSAPSTVDGKIGNIIIGESPTPVLVSVYKNTTQSLSSNDTLAICPSDTAIIIAQSIQNGSGSWTPTWQWYKNGLPISGQTNDTLLVQGSINTDIYWVEETGNLCDAISDTFYLKEFTYLGSLTVSSQYYNPPNAVTAVVTGGSTYFWYANKPVFLDNVLNDTVQIGLMSDSTSLFVDIQYGPNCLFTDSLFLRDTSQVICDAYDTNFVDVFDTIAIFDTNFVDVFDTIAVFDTIPVFDTIAECIPASVHVFCGFTFHSVAPTVQSV